MKEFNSQTGGRYTYIDDFLNLQELALAITAIFDGCDNFIVSGCNTTTSSITPGIVYINGKLRVCNGLNNIQTWPQYIYEVNSTENTPYQSGGEKTGRNVWGCAVGSAVPMAETVLTGRLPQSITIYSDGGPRMKDAWLGRYAVLLDSAVGSQQIKGKLGIQSLTGGQISAQTKLGVNEKDRGINLYMEDDKLVIESIVDLNTKYRLVASAKEDGFTMYKNSTAIATFSANGIQFEQPISTSQAIIGSIKIVGSDIYNHSTASDEGNISINLLGLGGKNDYYRNTYIGNGKGDKVFSIIGQDSKAILNGELDINSDKEECFKLTSNKSKTDITLKKMMVWQDVAGNSMVKFGYTESDSYIFRLLATTGSVKIEGSAFVDLGPAIRENGMLLTDKYMLKSEFAKALGTLQNAGFSYSKTESDNKYAAKGGGFSQFITATHTQDKLLTEIGAAKQADVALKDKYLSDMAVSEEAKRQIRANIGAAGINDLTPAEQDTGWIKIEDSRHDLYVRQIGKIVSIQGTLTTIRSGTIFTLPNNIDPPKHTVGCVTPIASYSIWGCQIEGGKKICTVVAGKDSGLTVPFSLTYMI